MLMLTGQKSVRLELGDVLHAFVMLACCVTDNISELCAHDHDICMMFNGMNLMSIYKFQPQACMYHGFMLVLELLCT